MNFKLGAWLLAARLRTLPLSLSGILMGTFLALRQGKFDWKIFLLSCLTTILYQVLSNFANDYGDGIKGTDDNRIGPKRVLQAGLISSLQLKYGLIITGVLSFLITILLLYVSFIPQYLNYFFIFIGLGIASILAALFYTLGKKPYGYYGFGDIFVFIFFGIVGVFGSYFLYTKSLDWYVLLPASAVGFFSVSVLNLNNMRDVENDKASNKNTLVVKIGLKYAKIYQVVLLNLPFFLCLVYVMTKCKPNTFYQLFFLLLILIFAPIRRKILYITNPKDFDPFLKQVSLLTLVFVLLFGIGINYEKLW